MAMLFIFDNFKLCIISEERYFIFLSNPYFKVSKNCVETNEIKKYDFEL